MLFRSKLVYYDSKHLLIVEDYESNVAAIESFVKELWAMPTQVRRMARQKLATAATSSPVTATR